MVKQLIYDSCMIVEIRTIIALQRDEIRLRKQLSYHHALPFI